jgi:hypothetical protein
MDTPVVVAIISAAAAVSASSLSFYLTKSKERQADWQRYKFELYKELVQSLSGIVGWEQIQARKETGVSRLPVIRFI